MLVSKKAFEVLGRAACHCNFLQICSEYQYSETDEQRWKNIQPITESVGSEDGYNWSAGPMTRTPSWPYMVMTKLGVLSGDETIDFASTGGSGYGDSQIAIDFGRVLFLHAETCGKHWVTIVIVEAKIDQDEKIFVLCDGNPSHGNWADEEETNSMTEEERAEYRSNKLME